jgi:hypothetical protein
MSSKNTGVFGIYKSGDQAERAVDAIIAAGFPSASVMKATSKAAAP